MPGKKDLLRGVIIDTKKKPNRGDLLLQRRQAKNSSSFIYSNSTGKRRRREGWEDELRVIIADRAGLGADRTTTLSGGE